MFNILSLNSKEYYQLIGMFTLTFVICLAPWNYKTNRNTCKKNPLLCMHDIDCRWFIVENAKVFQSYVKHF